LAVANIYGWTGGTPGSNEAERTDDILAIVRQQFKEMLPGPKAIVGDFNGTVEAFPTLQAMLEEEGWTDVGNSEAICKGKRARNTCHTNAKSNESRIDYIIANDRLTPAIKACWVDQQADLPTHKPLAIEVDVKEMKRVTRMLAKPTDFAELFEQKIREDVAQLEQEHKEGRIQAGHPMLDKKGEPNVNKVRSRNTQELQTLMDQQVASREYRFKLAEMKKDTTRQWDLVAAATEAAVIEYMNLKGNEAKRMRGRSKVRFMKQEEDALSLEKVESVEQEETQTKAEWLKKSSSDHSTLGNKLSNIAKRMIANERHKANEQAYRENVAINEITMERYKQHAEIASKKKSLSDQRRKQIDDNMWKKS
jgi:hypothetical protein